MNRAPIVLAGTAAGIAGVLAYHTATPSTGLVSATPPATSAQTTSSGSSSAVSRTTSASSSASATTTTSRRTAVSRARTATGQDVAYEFGDLELSVTKAGSRITHIAVVRLSVPDPRSQSIDQYAVPQLTRQAMTAQSADIDGVSGASYTSAAYRQALQSALDKLA